VIVISDASPLIALAAIQKLDLLRALYFELVVPTAVYDEITAARPTAPGSNDVRETKWIQVRSVKNRALVEALTLELDAGEAEAITLAVELDADLLLMDERRGRIAASRLGRRVVGVLGLVIEAKAAGILPAVRPVVDALTIEAGFRISQALLAKVLASAGE
jgi:predicted nucleic acid-binding protein